MRKNILFTIVLASLLPLSGCSANIDYGEFTLVSDSESAETIFDDYKLKNKNVADVDECEIVAEMSGSFENNENETIPVNVVQTVRAGIKETKYAFDNITKSDDGTSTSYTRFDETTNKYYTCNALDFSYEENDVETVVNSNNIEEVNSLNENPSKIYTVEDISHSLVVIHELAFMTYSKDMNIYTSNKGYMKYEDTTEDGTAENTIVDENGYIMKSDAWFDDLHMVLKITYSANFEDINMDDYETRDDEYLEAFTQSQAKFTSLFNPGF